MAASKDPSKEIRQHVEGGAGELATALAPREQKGQARGGVGLASTMVNAGEAIADLSKRPSSPNDAAARLGQGLAGSATNAARLAGAPEGVVEALGKVEGAAGLLGNLADLLHRRFARRLAPARFDFSMVTGPAPAFEVRSLRWRETLCQPYEGTLLLATTSVDAPTDALEGQTCELYVEREDELHALRGVIDRVDYVEESNDIVVLRVRVVPAFALLKHHVGSRIFQGTAPEILKAVLVPVLAKYGREVDLEGLQSDRFLARDYCVQYRESVFDFCTRIMAEEGILYYFEPDDENRRERLVLVEASQALPDLDLVAEEEIPIIPDRFEEADRESIQSFEWIRETRPNKVTSRGHNWKLAPGLEEEAVSLYEDHVHQDREVFEHDDYRPVVDDPIADPAAASFTGEGSQQRQSRAELALQAHRALKLRAEGKSNVVAMAAGHRFRLGEHTRADLDGKAFVALEVVHEGEVTAPGEEETRSGYANHFVAIPADTDYRMSRAASGRPRVYGPQTGFVVGPPGQEIHTDPYGRVKVRFHWDREGTPDDTASCWIRVAQSWAGAGWGTLFVPRVGMEVVVHFLDGDPDRPIITGCVYGGDRQPPWILPEDRSKSGFVSSSTPGGNGGNEFSFDDAAGAEEIYMHAQRNLRTLVKDFHQHEVLGPQQVTVHKSRTLEVKRMQITRVGGNDELAVGGKHQIVVKGDSKAAPSTLTSTYRVENGSYLVSVMRGMLETRVADGNWDLQVSRGNALTRVVQGDAKTLVGQGQHVIEVEEGDATLHLGKGSHRVTVNGDSLQNVLGGSFSVYAADKSCTLSAKESIVLQCGDSSVVIKPEGIEIRAPKLTFAAEGEAELLGKSTSLKGTSVLVQGEAMTTVRGRPIHLNPPG